MLLIFWKIVDPGDLYDTNPAFFIPADNYSCITSSIYDTAYTGFTKINETSLALSLWVITCNKLNMARSKCAVCLE